MYYQGQLVNTHLGLLFDHYSKDLQKQQELNFPQNPFQGSGQQNNQQNEEPNPKPSNRGTMGPGGQVKSGTMSLGGQASHGYPVNVKKKEDGSFYLVDSSGNPVSKESKLLSNYFQKVKKDQQDIKKFKWKQDEYVYNVPQKIRELDQKPYQNLKQLQQLNGDSQNYKQFNRLRFLSEKKKKQLRDNNNYEEWYKAYSNGGTRRDQQLDQMVVSQFSLNKKRNKNLISDKDKFQYAKQRPPQYLIGQFASFARQKQQQILQKQKLIKWIIREAVISYSKKLKQNYDALKQISNASTSQEQLLFFFNSMQDVKKFIDDQVMFTTKEAKQSQFFSIYKILKIFIARKKLIRKTAYVDGKFLKLSQLKIAQRFYVQKLIYIPTNNGNIYIRFTPNQAPVQVVFRQNMFFSAKQLEILDQTAKNQIIQMVMLYLKQKKIVLNKLQAQIIQKKIIQQIYDKVGNNSKAKKKNH